MKTLYKFYCIQYPDPPIFVVASSEDEAVQKVSKEFGNLQYVGYGMNIQDGKYGHLFKDEKYEYIITFFGNILE
jgi:hypothetical protein